ncbi:retrovirus-related Pol polyprotein from transposon 297 [Trichonephila inaurata madagascariensis]|uniref:RNA-directed DNA polymerase n=1 Tax=Trichonephila inaurata madagascariensis TaxID=2747483 RepID=A0A8X6K1J0_9ARAC|nr:retrovirus-related Pol polyprotein from transposon 297 [Trichonephila inaurata madagascariensis]
MISPDLDANQKRMLVDVLQEYSEAFKESKNVTPQITVKHRINTGDNLPVKQRAYRVSSAERHIIHDEVEKMLDKGIIQPSESLWSSPVILTLDDHLQRLQILLKCIQDAGLFLNPKKCVFGSQQIKILGHLVSEEGIVPDPQEKLASNFPAPKNIHGILCKKNFDPNERKWLPIIPKHLYLEILQQFHDASTAGHLGFAKTYDRIWKHFFWPGLYRSVRRYVMHCRECQRRKSVPQKPPGSTKGNKWIIVCTDYLSRFAVTKALPTAEAEEVAKFITEEIVLKHGAPRTILTDRGKVFESKLVTELGQLCSSKHIKTTGYHPQMNGLTERFNKTLADMLSMYVDVEQTNWDEILPFVTFAYNTAKQETTGYTPFYLLHGREAETTLDTVFPYIADRSEDDYMSRLVTRAEESRQLARIRTLEAQHRDKTRYDARHRSVSYRPGELVWIFTPVRKVGLSEKLLKCYFGPYRVVRKLSDVTYEVEELEPSPRRRKFTQVVHALHMKKYYTPEAQERILTNDTEKFPSNSPAGASYNVGMEKRDTPLDSPGEIVLYRGPMTRCRM